VVEKIFQSGEGRPRAEARELTVMENFDYLILKCFWWIWGNVGAKTVTFENWGYDPWYRCHCLTSALKCVSIKTALSTKT